MKKKPVSIMIAASLLLAGIALLVPVQKPGAKTLAEPAVTYTAFGCQLFTKLAGEREQNVFISPVSVAFALAMTYNGAAGETRQAMARTLEIQGLSLEAFNRGNARLRRALEAPDPKIRLNLANSLWLNQGQSFQPEFLKNNQEYYGAALQVLNLSGPGAPAAINAWVSKETAGKISRIVDKVQPPLVLVNAVYFKGTWTRPFNQALTRELPFHLAGGGRKQVPMMTQSGSYSYFQGPNFQAVSLPYGGDKRFGLKVFLPAPDSSLKQFLRELHPANWQSWLASMQPLPGAITLPRFKAAYGASLQGPLQALGMAPAFDRRHADFSNLCPPPGAYIGDVVHRAVVEVNEEGTEAAAATAVIMETTARRVQPPQTFTMVVDRPFFVAIDDRATGALLFLGAIFEP